MEIIRTWKYKDAWRYWWEITLWKSGERAFPDCSGASPEESQGVDFEWSYHVTRDDVGIMDVYRGSIVGQLDEIPDLCDVLLDFSNYIQSVCLGFAEFSKAEEEKNDVS